MTSKKCKDCGEVKDKGDFYGIQGECKECTKLRVSRRKAELAKDPHWVISERARHREKSRKYRDDGRAKPNQKSGHTPKFKRKAHSSVEKAIMSGRLKKEKCMFCGGLNTQAHHEDYSKPLDVNWLCVRHHNDRHIHIRDCKILKVKPKTIEAQLLSHVAP